MKYCATTGMFRTGKVKPLSRKNGMKQRNVDIMACCCVRTTVEMNNPAPNEESRNSSEPSNSTHPLPRNGT